MTNTAIMLHSRRLFDFAKPEENNVLIEDIAHGLSNICRYAGHCNSFYSVAEHSVYVSEIAKEFELEGLLHDATEAFLGDVSRPLKRLLPDYRDLEKRIEKTIFKQFSLRWPLPTEVKEADNQVMATEMRVVMPPGTADCLPGVAPADIVIRWLSPKEAKRAFLVRYFELYGGS